MTETTTERPGYIGAAEAARMIRPALKAAFPGTKFSVRSSHFAGGSAIDVSWTDGPTDGQVRTITDPFRGGGFDGMIDMAYSSEAWLLPDGSVTFARTSGTEGSRGTVPAAEAAKPHPEARLVSFLAKYVQTQRHFSPELKAWAATDEAAAVLYPGPGWRDNDQRTWMVLDRTAVDPDGTRRDVGRYA